MKFTAKVLIFVIMVSLLTACKSWNVQVDLTPEEKAQIQTEIKDLNVLIEKYMKDTKNVENWEDAIPHQEIIRVAQAYEKLGDIESAVKTYKNVLDKGYKTKAIINNLGRLYEQVGEYDLAVKQYLLLVDEYMDRNYLYDITWAYIRAAQSAKGDDIQTYRKEAEKSFNSWQLEFRKTDEQTQQAIKKLRAGEK
jgi:tetratricopeptide (TPR) repeat protein